MTKKTIKGKISRIFQELKEGDRVGVDIDISEERGFPKRIQGKTGIVEKRKGKAYIVKIRDNNKEKKYIIKPVHLVKINPTKSLTKRVRDFVPKKSERE